MQGRRRLTRGVLVCVLLLAWAAPIHAQPEVTTSGTITALEGAVSLAVSGTGSGAVQLTGTWTATIQFEATVDDLTWVAVTAIPTDSTTTVTSTTGNGAWLVGTAGYRRIRVRASAFASGPVVVTLRVVAGASQVHRGAGGGSGSGGAPDDAEYWLGAPSATLLSAHDLSALVTGLVLNTGGTPSAYAGTSCTNQFPRSLSASGAATCASVALAADVSGDLPFANIAQIVTASVLGRNTAGTGDIEALSTLPSAVQDNITRLGTVTVGNVDALVTNRAIISGTPANNQIAVWTSATQVEGGSDFTWSGTDLVIAGSAQTIRLTRATDNTSGAAILLRKARGTPGAESIVLDGDNLFQFIGSGWTAAGAFANVAQFRAIADGEWGTAGDTTDSPTRWEFLTAPDGSSTQFVRMVINRDGNVLIGNSPAYPTTGSMGLIFGDGTALSGMGSNTAGLYADDVGGTVNLFAINEAGEITRLTWGTPQTYTESNVTVDRAYNANATTIDELADILGTLIADLRARGVVN